MPKSTRWLIVITIILAAGCIMTWYLWWQLPAHEDKLGLTKTAEPLSVPDLVGRADDDVLEGKNALVLVPDNNQIVFDYNAFERAPVASLTKLMTAMVALDYGLDWDKPMEIQLDEYVTGGNLLLHPGETVTVKDLFHASVLGSANNATLAYVRSLGVPDREFVRAMNRKAVELGLEQTHFTDVTGLETTNVSTAYEVALMAKAAFMYPEIASASSAPTYMFVVGGSGREHEIRNTNKLAGETEQKFSGSKTGFLYEAGYCLVTKTGDNGRIAVVLNAPSEEAQYRDMQRLLNLPAW